MKLVLGVRLAELPSPTDVLKLRAEGFGPHGVDVRCERLRVGTKACRLGNGCEPGKSSGDGKGS